jgi:hypothetical protein
LQVTEKNKSSNDMKEEIYKICTKLNDGQIAVVEAQEQLLLLFSVSKQREQLISFFNWYKDDPKELSNNKTIVDAYLEESKAT